MSKNKRQQGNPSETGNREAGGLPVNTNSEVVGGTSAPVQTLNIVADDVPYIVTARPFSFNDKRFYVSINGGEQHVFCWDEDLKRLRAIDDEAAIIPEALEEAISARIVSPGR